MKQKHLLKNIFIVALFLLTCATPITGHSKDTGIGNEFPSLIKGVRPEGMGSAFIAMNGTDAIAQFYNPAAINDYEATRKYYVGAPMAELSPGALGAINGLFNLRTDLRNATSSAQKIDIFKAFTEARVGEYNYFATSMPLFHVRHKRYALGVVGENRTIISLRNQAFPNFDFKTLTNTGIIAGSAYGFFDESLQVGANIKALFRMSKEDEITSGDILTYPIKSLIGFGAWNKGFGAGADIGIKYKLPIWKDALKPTLAVTVQDIADTRFTGGVEKMPMSVSVGGGIFPKFGSVDFALTADFRELNQRIDFLNKFHAGMEARFPEIYKTRISLRAGCNQGYPAMGFSAYWGLVEWNFAYYAEEAGDYTHNSPNYRLSSQVGFNF